MKYAAPQKLKKLLGRTSKPRDYYLTKNQILTIHVNDLQHFSAKKKLKNHFFL